MCCSSVSIISALSTVFSWGMLVLLDPLQCRFGLCCDSKDCFRFTEVADCCTKRSSLLPDSLTGLALLHLLAAEPAMLEHPLSTLSCCTRRSSLLPDSTTGPSLLHLLSAVKPAWSFGDLFEHPLFTTSMSHLTFLGLGAMHRSRPPALITTFLGLGAMHRSDDDARRPPNLEGILRKLRSPNVLANLTQT